MSNNIPSVNPNKVNVNGPVNVVRLEGDVDNIKKVIYLFLDYHIDVRFQTQCKNVFSDDIQKYFINSFYELGSKDKIYDFFVEIYPSELSNRKFRSKDYKEKYIEEVVKFFRKIFKYDSKKNKVMVNKFFKNIRLHYIDIRDYYKLSIHSKMMQMNNIAHKFMTTDRIDTLSLDKIIKLMEEMREHLQLIINILTKDPQKVSREKIIKERFDADLDLNVIKYLAKKIKTSYKHPDVKKIMNNFIMDSVNNFKATIKFIAESRQIFIDYGDRIDQSEGKLVPDDNTSYIYSYGLSTYTIRYMIVDIVNRVEKLFEENFVEFFARFTDIYFLRRFLDKDYITNVVAYTGALHSITYIHVLINYFGFKITHASYTQISDLKKLNSEIRKKSQMDIQPFVLPETLEQCSDMTKFPSNFL